jgi:hypothetical protein
MVVILVVVVVVVVVVVFVAVLDGIEVGKCIVIVDNVDVDTCSSSCRSF